MSFVFTNAAAILSLISLSLSVAVGIAHLMHKDAVALEIESLQSAVNKLMPVSSPSSP